MTRTKRTGAATTWSNWRGNSRPRSSTSATRMPLSIARMVELALDAYGDVDVLVACAGIEIGDL